MSGASNGVQPPPNVEIVVAVPKHGPPEPDVTLTEGAQCSTSDLVKVSVETVSLVASNEDVEECMGDAVAIPIFSRDRYTAEEILAQLSQITEIPYQRRGVRLHYKGRIKSSFQVYGY